MIKNTIVLVVIILFSYTGFAQENNTQELVKKDTVEVETTLTTNEIQPISNQETSQVSQAKAKKEKQPKLNKNKVYYGGYLNLSFGSYTAIGVEPLVGYKVTPQFSLGGKVSYTFVNDKRYSQDYSTSNYGLSLFSRYRISPRLYAHVEYSAMNYELYNFEEDSEREWVSFLFVGGGFSQPITKNSWLTAQVLFDVLQNENSPYKNWEPFFSVGVGVGF
jgi:hypothetical protein